MDSSNSFRTKFFHKFNSSDVDSQNKIPCENAISLRFQFTFCLKLSSALNEALGLITEAANNRLKINIF